jgi:hypothetical protein
MEAESDDLLHEVVFHDKDLDDISGPGVQISLELLQPARGKEQGTNWKVRLQETPYNFFALGYKDPLTPMFGRTAECPVGLERLGLERVGMNGAEHRIGGRET